MFNITADGSQRARVKLRGVDSNNLLSEWLTNTSATVNNPSLATCSEDTDNPGQWLVVLSPQANPTVAPVSVQVTIVDNETGLGDSGTVLFQTGAVVTFSAVASPEIIPAPGE